MRRWFELGFNGDNPFIPSYNFADAQLFYLRSERNGGRGNPIFVAMPFKEQLFETIAALSVINFTDVSLRPLTLSIVPIDQGVDPAPDCTALHLPREYSFTTGGPNTPMLMPNIYAQLVGGFIVVDATGHIVGSTPALWDWEFSPQTEN